jgi:hypothetical protein
MIRRIAAGAAALALVATGSLALAPTASATGTKTTAGTTTVTLTDAALGALGPLNPRAVKPATLGAGPTGVEAAFPITKVTKDGRILHSGGLALSKGRTTLKLTNYAIDTSTGKLTALVTINGYRLFRIALFDVALTAPTAGCDASADLTLTRTGSFALQVLFRTPNLTGAPIGKACVDLA